MTKVGKKDIIVSVLVPFLLISLHGTCIIRWNLPPQILLTKQWVFQDFHLISSWEEQGGGR